MMHPALGASLRRASGPFRAAFPWGDSPWLLAGDRPTRRGVVRDGASGRAMIHSRPASRRRGRIRLRVGRWSVRAKPAEENRVMRGRRLAGERCTWMSGLRRPAETSASHRPWWRTRRAEPAQPRRVRTGRRWRLGLRTMRLTATIALSRHRRPSRCRCDDRPAHCARSRSAGGRPRRPSPRARAPRRPSVRARRHGTRRRARGLDALGFNRDGRRRARSVAIGRAVFRTMPPDTAKPVTGLVWWKIAALCCAGTRTAVDVPADEAVRRHEDVLRLAARRSGRPE